MRWRRLGGRSGTPPRDRRLSALTETSSSAAARENSLKDVSLRIPKRPVTIFTGVSGSGIATEAQRQLWRKRAALGRSAPATAWLQLWLQSTRNGRRDEPGKPGLERKRWSRRSDSNRGPAVYELDRPGAAAQLRAVPVPRPASPVVLRRLGANRRTRSSRRRAVSEAGRSPYDPALSNLVGLLPTRSEVPRPLGKPRRPLPSNRDQALPSPTRRRPYARV